MYLTPAPSTITLLRTSLLRSHARSFVQGIKSYHSYIDGYSLLCPMDCPPHFLFLLTSLVLYILPSLVSTLSCILHTHKSEELR